MMTAEQFYGFIADNIAKHGVHIMSVFPRTDSPPEDRHTYSYTIGLWPVVGYELIIVGTGPVGHPILHAIAKTALKHVNIPTDEPLPPADEQHPERLNEWAKSTLVIKACDHPDLFTKWAVQAQRYFGRDAAVKVRQVVWPDTTGKFPWDPEVEPKWRDAQPLLFRAN